MSDTNTSFAHKLLKWFDSYGRKDLPWQLNKSHYEVWISEVMLQQTQVQTVIDYFKRFIERFPGIQSLALATEDDVLQLWAGLGYYARARNLHKTAKIICQNYAGKFPNTLDELTALPGLGRSTASAILSIADNQPLAILDGNVKRVLSRLHCVEGAIQDSKTLKKLWELSEKETPHFRNAEYTQAIMDLGATLCTRKNPNCAVCPASSTCKAFLKGCQNEIPLSQRKLKRSTQHTECLLLTHKGLVLLTRRPSKGIWGGLYTPILHEDTTNIRNDFLCEKEQHLPTRKHVFTHIDLFYTPIICEVQEPERLDGYDWHKLEDAIKLALPRPIQKLLNEALSGKLAPQLSLQI